MSETYDLCCTDCRESIWIGQGHDTTLYFYSAEPETVAAFNIFLRRHLTRIRNNRPHNLVVMETQEVPPDYREVQNVYKDADASGIVYDLTKPLG